MYKNVIMKTVKYFKEKMREVKMNEKIEELKELLSESKFLGKKEEKKTNPIVIVLAVIGAIAAVAGIAYAVYRFLIPEDSEYFEDFEDFEDFDDEEFEDDDFEGDE